MGVLICAVMGVLICGSAPCGDIMGVLICVIAGLTDQFPYREKQYSVVPKVKGAPVAAG